MDKGGKDPKVLAQAAKHFEKFFTSEVRRKGVRKSYLGYHLGVRRHHGQLRFRLRAFGCSTWELYPFLPRSKGDLNPMIKVH